MTEPQYTVPGPPLNVTAVAGDARATVTYEQPNDTGGLPITAYLVRSNQGHEAEVEAQEPPTPVEVLGLINGEPYTFAVSARNAMGDGELSAYSTEVRPRTVPTAPKFLTATVDDGQTEISFNPPTSSGGSPITGYLATARPESGIGQDFSATGSASPILITGLTNGTTYIVGVVAQNAAGNSAPSAPPATVTPQGVEESGPYKPFPNCARFDLTKEVNQAQLDTELTEALGFPVQIATTKEDPSGVGGYLWVVPETVDVDTVTNVINDHVPQADWGMPESVRAFNDILRRVVADPSITLTAEEMQVAVKGLLSRYNVSSG